MNRTANSIYFCVLMAIFIETFPNITRTLTAALVGFGIHASPQMLAAVVLGIRGERQ